MALGTAAVPGLGNGIRPVKAKKNMALKPTIPRKTRIGVLLEPELKRRVMGSVLRGIVGAICDEGNRRIKDWFGIVAKEEE